MTAGPGSNPIKNFQDVIDRDINVVARHSTSNHEVLKTAVEGTPMYNYYYDTMHDDPNYFVKVRLLIFICVLRTPWSFSSNKCSMKYSQFQ